MAQRGGGEKADVKTRGEIIAAGRALFAVHGLKGVSISDIAAASGVAKSTVFHHFGSKSGLYREVLEEVNASLSALVAAPLVERVDQAKGEKADGSSDAPQALLAEMRQLLRLILVWAREQEDHACIIMHELLELRSREDTPRRWVLASSIARFEDVIGKARRAGVVQDENPEAILELIFAAAIYRSVNSSFRHLSRRRKPEAEQSMERATLALLERAILKA